MGIVAMLAVAWTPATAYGWAATGHHVIAVMAFDLLSTGDQAEVMRILSKHPDFDRRFHAPDGMTDIKSIELWQIGVAGCWPDMVRKSAADRPTWHYQLAGTALLGDKAKVNPPIAPGPLPSYATLATKDLYIGQAYDLCRRILGDTSQPDTDRAIALCWLCHLVADGHQPCHAGSLYAVKVFPDGDRGGNSIHVGKSNLHSIWDNLLGSSATANNVRKRVVEVQSDKATIDRVIAHRDSFGYDGIEKWIDASLWLSESRNAGRKFVYTPEVLESVTAVMRGLKNDVELPNLTDEYYANAGKAATTRATQASYRLAAVFTIALHQ